MEAESTDTGVNELNSVTFKTEIDVDNESGVKYNVELYQSSDWPSEFDTNQYKSSCSRNTVDDSELLPETIVETQVDEDVKPTPDLLYKHYYRGGDPFPCDPPSKKNRRKTRSITARKKKYYCDICQFGTIYRHVIKIHLLKHAIDKSYECDECQFKTKYPTTLHRHKQSHDGTRPSYSCPFCDYVGHDSSTMKTHITRQHTPQGPFQCIICNFNTVYKYEYQVHMKTHVMTNTSHPQDATNTDNEQTEGTNERAIDEQIREPKNIYNLIQNYGSGKVYKCKTCQYTSFASARIKAHAVMHSDSRPFKCKLCNFTSKHSTALRRHERYQHTETYNNKILVKKDGSGKVYKCNTCQYTSFSPARIKTHAVMHSDSRPFKCKLCNFTSKHSTALCRHERYQHTETYNNKVLVKNDGSGKVYKCNTCQYISFSPARIKTHAVMHSDSRPFKCKLCNFTSKHSTALRRHERYQHTETYNNKILVKNDGSGKVYKCNTCQYTSFSPARIKTHAVMHSDSRPFKCKLCNFTSKHSTALRRHERYQHTETYNNKILVKNDGSGKVYKCNTCQYTSFSPARIKTHAVMHSDSRPFKCKLCNFTSKHSTALRRHERYQHTETYNNKILVKNDGSGKVYKCNTCQYTSFSPARIKTHAVMHSDSRPFKCKLCNFTSKHSTALRRHERYQHTETYINKILLSCNECNYTTYDPVRMKYHNDHTHVCSYNCMACKFRTGDDMAYLTHIISRHNMIQLKRTKVALSKKKFNSRKETEENNENDPLSLSDVSKSNPKIKRKKWLYRITYTCNHCYYKTVDRKKMIYHSSQTPHKGYKYFCECEFATKDPTLFNIHLKSSCDHIKYSCVACNLVATTKQELEEHVKSHIQNVEPDGQVIMMKDEDNEHEVKIVTDEQIDTHCIVEARDFNVTRGLPEENGHRELRLYKCMLCDFATQIRQNLSNHLKEHSPPYNCRLCDHTTKYLSSLRRHVTMHSEGNFQFKCELCDFTTSQALYLKLHMRKHSMKKQYKCDSCPFETSYRNCIIKHVRVHTKTCFQTTVEEGAEQFMERRTYNCDHCEFQAFSEGRVIKHRYKKHGVPLPPEFTKKCDYCDFCTKDKWKLKVHYQKSYRGSLIKCQLCDFETEYKCLLKTHLLQHPDHFVPNSRSNVPSGLSCSSSHSGVSAHSEGPSPAAVVYQFIDNHQVDYLEWNEIPVHDNPADEKRFKCPHCLFASKYKHGVRRHFQRHHIRNNKQYHCLNCSFVTSTEISLDRHNRVSKSTDPLICSRCNQFTTFYKCELAIHAKTHDKFACSTCDYSCNSKYILARHVMKCHNIVYNQ